MKTFEELNTYPAPWTYDRPTQCVLDKDSWPVAELVDKRNAGVMIAAPDMYVALFKITKEQECGQDCTKCKNNGCVIKECKAALAKASGEGEV